MRGNAAVLIFTLVFNLYLNKGSIMAQQVSVGSPSNYETNSPDVLLHFAKVIVRFENRNRFSWGPLSEECSWPREPFGNWGVDSNFSAVINGHQFDGWCRGGSLPCTSGSLYQWNSCTTQEEFWPPHCDYYNYPINVCTQQKTTTGVNSYGGTEYCWVIPTPYADQGCSYINGKTLTFSGSYISAYEIDDFGPDDFIKTLYYPNLQRTITGCTVDNCPYQTSSWYNVSSWSPAGNQVIDAQVRLVIDGCDLWEGQQCP